MNDPANWDGETVVAANEKITFSNTGGSVSYVTNDLSYKFSDTTVVDGAWEFAGTETFYPGHALLMGNQGKTVSIVNYADWNCDYYFAIANESNSTVVFTNRAGTITCRASAGSMMPGVTVGGRYNQEDSSTGTSGTFVFEGGTLTATRSFEVGYGKNCTGVFIQTGGTITADRLGIANTVQKGTGSRGTVILKGGTFATQRIAIGNGTSGTVTFDGGTLQLTSSHSAAIQNSTKLAVNVGAGGGTISLADGVVSTIPASISSAVSGGTDGGLKITGGGRLVFTGALSYTGATTVEVGTTVVFADPSSIGGGLAVTIPETPPDAGVYTVFSTTGDGTLEAAFAAATLPAGDANARFRLSADKKSILCLYGDVAQEWIGGATGSLGDAANWSTGIVPTDGNAVITSGSAATLASSAAFTPDSITFPSGTAQITIAGDAGISGLLAVTNEASGVHHVFECPVSFAANAEADISCGSGTYVKFAGGMTAYTLRQTGSEAYISGDITLTKNIANWAANVEIDLLHLCAGATLTIPQSVTVNGTANFKLDSGTRLNINGDITVKNKNGAFSSVNNGVIAVSGKAINDQSGTDAAYFAASASSGVIKASGILNEGGRFVPNAVNGGGTWVVGADGISNSAGDFYVQKSQRGTFRPAADFALNSALSGNSTSYWTFNTTDYEDSTARRTITVNQAISVGAVTVSGNGTMLFNVSGGTSKGLTANDSATIAVNAGKQPCNGTVTMNGTSTLKVAQSGSVSLGGKLTLGSTASLAFNFTDKAAAPTLAIPVASTIPETVNVKISANEGVRPSSSQTYTLTSTFDFTGKAVNLVDKPDWVKSVDVVDGNLVLTVKFGGFIISIY